MTASLAEDCRAVPSRLECKDWAAAKAAAAARHDDGALGATQGEVGGDGGEGGGGWDGGEEEEEEEEDGWERGRAAVQRDASSLRLPEALARPLRHGAPAGGIMLRGGGGGGGGGGSGGGSTAAEPAQQGAAAGRRWLHPSGALLVADDPLEFAKAAVAALGDAQLWEMLSAEGLRQQRLLCPARQSAVLGGALRLPLLIEPPAEQAQPHIYICPSYACLSYTCMPWLYSPATLSCRHAPPRAAPRHPPPRATGMCARVRAR